MPIEFPFADYFKSGGFAASFLIHRVWPRELYAAMDWNESNKLSLTWAADAVEEQLRIDSTLIQDSHIEVLLTYESADYVRFGSGTAPDVPGGLKWYVRTASSYAGLDSANWAQITTVVTTDTFVEESEMTVRGLDGALLQLRAAVHTWMQCDATRAALESCPVT